MLDKKEDKINYYYEPRFSKKEKGWKRCYIINELKKDFITDVNNFGFSPFIEFRFKEQIQDKNIMKYFNANNYDFSQYIKKMYILIHDKQKLNRQKLKEEQNRSFQIKTSKFNLFHNRQQNSRNNKSYLNIYRHNLKTKNKTPKVKKLTQIVKFSREEIVDMPKIQEMKLINNELESSFNYKTENKSNSYLGYQLKDKSSTKSEKKYGEEDLSNKIETDDIIIHYKEEKPNKKNSLRNRIKSFKNQTIKEKTNIPKNIQIKKIKIKKEADDQFFWKRNIGNKFSILNDLESPFNKNKTFYLGKFDNNKRKYLDLNEAINTKKKRNLYLERLENYSGGIFKTAMKYQYPTKTKKK